MTLQNLHKNTKHLRNDIKWLSEEEKANLKLISAPYSKEKIALIILDYIRWMTRDNKGVILVFFSKTGRENRGYHVLKETIVEISDEIYKELLKLNGISGWNGDKRLVINSDKCNPLEITVKCPTRRRTLSHPYLYIAIPTSRILKICLDKLERLTYAKKSKEARSYFIRKHLKDIEHVLYRYVDRVTAGHRSLVTYFRRNKTFIIKSEYLQVKKY